MVSVAEVIDIRLTAGISTPEACVAVGLSDGNMEPSDPSGAFHYAHFMALDILNARLACPSVPAQELLGRFRAANAADPGYHSARHVASLALKHADGLSVLVSTRQFDEVYGRGAAAEQIRMITRRAASAYLREERK